MKSQFVKQASGMQRTWICKVCHFYLNGFRAMTWGRTLWALILIKLFIMFFILKFFFFPSFLKDKEDKPEYVGNELIQRATVQQET